MTDGAASDVIPRAMQYRGFRLFEHLDDFYGVPPYLLRADLYAPDQLIRHPAVMSAPTRELLEARIDASDPSPAVCEPVGEFDGHELIRYGERVYGLPRGTDAVDLTCEADLVRDGVLCGDTREEIEDRVRADRTASPVEFLGWLPVFRVFGNCGAHPQFGHTQNPPPGYKFVRSCPRGVVLSPDDVTGPARRSAVTRLLISFAGVLAAPFRALLAFARNLWDFGPTRCLLTLALCLRLFAHLVRKTGRVIPALKFVRTRHFRSQVMAPRGADLVFVTSIPQTFGQNPWVIEIEDSTTLFFPFLPNGRTAEIEIVRSPYYEMVKALLESDSCRGILTHMRSTAESLPTLFRSEIIARKVSYAPLGVRVPKRWQAQPDDGPINLLFTNSWHQQGVGFYLRGGLDVLEAFDILRERYPQLRLTLRSGLSRLDLRYRRIIERRWVRVIDRFVPTDEMDQIQREAHIYLLPSARIHIVSVLQAMSYGQAVVVSDGWGMDEYVDHDRNGLVVTGRAGKVSWMDKKTGLLRENYAPMYVPDPAVVDGLVAAVSRLVEDGALRARIGRAARADVETRYNLGHWNAALKSVFDKARAAA
ncbi:MAG: hypothetical protein JWO38_6105 [Gemmataceae bacterium]|nr:hypothetical protein [Gemmataceae bacterium]